MSGSAGPSVHASAVLVGDRAVLIRGPSGAGKSRLAFDLILAGRTGQIRTAVLVGDDRVTLEARQGELVVRPVSALAGLIEISGLGIRRCDFAGEAIVGLVVDLNAQDAERLPLPSALRTTVAGIQLARLPVKSGHSPLPMVVASLTTTEGYTHVRHLSDCSKEIGNHISPTLAVK